MSFTTIATIDAIAGKNVQGSLRSYVETLFIAIETITEIIWKPAYIWKLLSDQSRIDRFLSKFKLNYL